MTKGASTTSNEVFRSASRRRTVAFGARQSAITPSGTKKSSTGLIVTLVVVLMLVLCGGGALALYLIGSKDSSPTAQKSAGSAGPVASASAGQLSAAASSGYDPTSIIKGQCVVNDGDENTPRLRVATCGAGTYLVLARFDGTDDTKKCDPVAGSTHNYYYQTTPATLDFVLCLKKQ